MLEMPPRIKGLCSSIAQELCSRKLDPRLHGSSIEEVYMLHTWQWSRGPNSNEETAGTSSGSSKMGYEQGIGEKEEASAERTESGGALPSIPCPPLHLPPFPSFLPSPSLRLPCCSSDRAQLASVLHLVQRAVGGGRRIGTGAATSSSRRTSAAGSSVAPSVPMRTSRARAKRRAR